MAIYEMGKIEFDLKVTKFEDKSAQDRLMCDREDKPDWGVSEELSFKSLSAKEVLRKLIDYIAE